VNNDRVNDAIAAREGIRLLAALIHVQHNGKLPMLDCLQLAEGVQTEALIVDSEQVRKWEEQQQQIDAQAVPVSNKVM
jgi:hypothetical protein